MSTLSQFANCGQNGVPNPASTTGPFRPPAGGTVLGTPASALLDSLKTALGLKSLRAFLFLPDGVEPCPMTA